MAKITITRPLMDFGSILVEVYNQAIPVVQGDLEDYANDIVFELKKAITDKSLRVKANKPGYKKWKLAHSTQGSTPLIDTGQYIDSISVIPVDGETFDGKPTAYIVGFRDEMHRQKETAPVVRKAYKQYTVSQMKQLQSDVAKATKNKELQKQAIYSKQEMPMIELAKILEFGTKDGRIKPRPHWRPVMFRVSKNRAHLKSKWTYKMQKAAKDAAEQFMAQTKTEEIE